MIRLQVGGLALIIKGRISDKNVGKVVRLVSFDGSELPWQIYCEDGLELLKNITKYGWITTDRLLPLGDQKTQDELRKKELENV